MVTSVSSGFVALVTASVVTLGEWRLSTTPVAMRQQTMLAT